MWHQACCTFRGNQPDAKGLFMTRVLMIDGNRKLTESVGRQCLERRVAIRMTDTFCEGIRQLLDVPASLVLLSADLVRLPGAELAKLFETIAPGVPVVVRVESGQGMDVQVKFELHGFRVVREPFDIGDLLAKSSLSARVVQPSPSAAAAAVEAACS
jgi:DNA-binding response OmpR family regulator